jgi:hypothetical protein
VLDSQVVFPIVGKGLVEFSIFFSLDIFRSTGPKRLGLVELFVFSDGFLDGLLLLFILLFVFISDFFNLGFSSSLFFIIRNFLFNFLFNNELNRVGDEFRVLLDNVLDSLFFKVFKLKDKGSISLNSLTHKPNHLLDLPS